ncbi:MAG: glycosyltransferase family protein [Alphaproteobacteria bacterium]|nr:glycosyltransferase family protein [Alphaproteobacteria bacterium]
MTTAIIVQARLGSTRLPGKVLMPLAGTTVLEEMLRRCRAIPGADVVVCAIPEDTADDALIAPATRAGAVVARGSAGDVLGRYRKAADQVDADVVVRITSDCPLADPGLCGDVIALRAARGVDYAANNMPPRFPHGLDCEAFTAQSLRRADDAARDPYEREHVTPWLRRNPAITRATLDGPGGDAAQQRWTLDFPEDYAFFQAVFAQLPPPPAIPDWRATLAVIDAHPEISAINAARRVQR